MKKTLSSLLLGTAILITAAADLGAQGFGASATVVSEGEVLIGEPLNEIKPGVVYVYGRSGEGWSERAQLMASDATDGDHFGRALAVHGNTLIAGATASNELRGAAYVFERDDRGNWSQVAVLEPADAQPEDHYGRKVAFNGEFAMFAGWGADESRGAVLVFRRAENGSWSDYGKLQPSDAAEDDWFGSAIALSGDLAFIGAARKDENKGVVYVFEHDAEASAWNEIAKLEAEGLEENARFGSAIATVAEYVLIGAPGYESFAGAVWVFARDPESGEWSEATKVRPFDGERGTQFGNALAIVGSDIWVSAPGADGRKGRVYVMHADMEAREWLGVTKLSGPDVEGGDRFANAFAVSGNTAVVGLGGDDYGAGTAIVLERAGDSWVSAGKVWSEIEGMEPLVGGEVECREGMIATFDCSDVDLVSFLPVQAIGGGRGVRVNDVWGWTDSQTGKEYALVGRLDGTAFVDISDPANPVYVGDLPKTADAPGSTWRDIKVYKDHAFIVADGAREHGMQVFKLARLREAKNLPVTFTEDAHYTNINSAHNIVINEESGFAYSVGSGSGGETCGGGLHMIDIRNPTQPTFAGCFADASTGRRRTGYTHDAQCVMYRGPDPDHQGKEICFGANETALSVADVTDKDNPVALSVAEYPNVGYSHQGWLTEDHRYFLMDDELDEIAGSVENTRTLIWDVEDLDDPVLLTEFFGPTRASDHNLYVQGNFVYQSNYVSGLRVLDISDIKNPVEIGYFDTVPYGENDPGFGGSWSNYPFFASGNIVVTSGREGVFIVRNRETQLVP